MWQFTITPVGDILHGHLLMGGLGGVITVIVGGIASVIAWRSAKRSAARPAPSPETPAIHRRPVPPISYGETAPPTSPARRLHPGPVSLSPSTPRPEPKQDDTEPGANLFNPDLSASASTPETAFTAPVWHTRDAIAAQSSIHAPLALEHDALPMPLWTTPLTRNRRLPDLLGETPLIIEAPSRVMEAPVWGASLLGGRLRLASATAETPDALDVAAQPMTAPVWTTSARPAETTEAEAALVEADASEAVDEIEPPIWSRSRRPT